MARRQVFVKGNAGAFFSEREKIVAALADDLDVPLLPPRCARSSAAAAAAFVSASAHTRTRDTIMKRHARSSAAHALRPLTLPRPPARCRRLL